MTKLTANQLALMAGILGVSNSGSDHLFNGPHAEWTVEKVKRHFANCTLTVDGVTTSIVMGLCENEEMLDMFLEEARSWESRLRQLSVEKIKTNWTRYAAFVECV